jgi:hypothetical protein
MIQCRCGARFTAKALHGLRVACNILRKELERYEPAKTSVFSFVDHAHATATDFADNAVVRDRFVNHLAGDVDDRATLNTSQFVPSAPRAGKAVSDRASPIASMLVSSGSRETGQDSKPAVCQLFSGRFVPAVVKSHCHWTTHHWYVLLSSSNAIAFTSSGRKPPLVPNLTASHNRPAFRLSFG